MTTKEKIYQSAIELFSIHGYHELGMRDLAKSVGIKASSIYNHYKSKEDILMDIAYDLIADLKQYVYPLYKRLDLSPREFFLNLSIETNNFFERQKINQLTKLIMPLQFQIERLRHLLHTEFIQKPRTSFNYYFKTLMEKGKMRKDDPMLAAKMYHSFFVYHFYEKFLSDKPDGFLVNYENLFRNHINLFMDYFNIA
ncbi:TetR/AcrR family transcriptional regulator [Acholeplasma granularum]|uniref:TetR/AcrR family transcriptional regulator n=1 Tax=Acholeplasma granularum TaxID=264635 RepID=UPI000472F729|nr:TetR/AcrR family transcriptional regulator [Acholeplasma granularum]